MARVSRSDVVLAGDAAAVVFVAVVTEWQVFSGSQFLGTHVAGPRWVTVPLPLLIAVPLLWRRRRPLLMCVLVIAGIVLQAVSSGNSPEGLQLILVWMLVPFSVAAYSPRRQGVMGLAIALVGFAVYAVENADITSGRADNVWAGAFFLILAVGSWLAGAVVHARRERTSLHARASMLERESQSAVEDERSRIARELHDIVSHNLSVVVVQAAGARAQVPPDTPNASTLEKIERSGREALVEMRRLLGVLRPDDGAGTSSLSPAPGISELPQLADGLRAAGLEVELTLDGDCSALPPACALTTYRIVQEALTNTLKHGGRGARAAVRIAHEPGALTIEVVDDGAGLPPGDAVPDGGHGLIGMRERAAVFGGEVRTASRPGGGFAVRARLPLELDRRS